MRLRFLREDSDAVIEVIRIPATMPSEMPTGTLKMSAINILPPTKTSTIDKPNCRKRNLSTMPASRK